MGRRKHSKIDNLEPAVKETVDEMIKTGAYYREIVDYIQSHGVSISLAAVGKYAKNLMSTLDALRLSQENFRAIMEETDRYPDLDMTDGILRLLCNQMLDADDFSMDDDEVIEVSCAPAALRGLREGLTEKGYHVLSAEVMQIPSTYTSLDDEEAIKKMNLLLENLEEDDDVQNVYHNWSMPDED